MTPQTPLEFAKKIPHIQLSPRFGSSSAGNFSHFELLAVMVCGCFGGEFVLSPMGNEAIYRRPF
jgi:hypothetical protein